MDEVPEKTGAGPMVSIVVVVVLVVLGGLYFFVHQAAKLHQVPTGQEPANS